MVLKKGIPSDGPKQRTRCSDSTPEHAGHPSGSAADRAGGIGRSARSATASMSHTSCSSNRPSQRRQRLDQVVRAIIAAGNARSVTGSDISWCFVSDTCQPCVRTRGRNKEGISCSSQGQQTPSAGCYLASVHPEHLSRPWNKTMTASSRG